MRYANATHSESAFYGLGLTCFVRRVCCPRYITWITYFETKARFVENSYGDGWVQTAFPDRIIKVQQLSPIDAGTPVKQSLLAPPSLDP